MKYSDIVAAYGLQLPNLAQTFEQVLSLAPQTRLKWAKEQLPHIYRDGWFINTPVGKNGDGETVSDHIKHLFRLIDLYFPEEHKEKAKAYAECHDDQEALAHAVIDGIRRDLNPRFNKASYQISDQDKEIIENFAADILFEAEPERKILWRAYRKCADETTVLFTGLDKVCVMWKCVDFIESGKYQYSDFPEYWDHWTLEYADKKLPPLISIAYREDLYPKIDGMRLG